MKSEHARMCATAKSREAMAARCKAIVEANGWTFWRNDILCRGREICFTASRSGHHVNFDFDGASRVNAFLAHWHADSGFTFPKSFGVYTGGDVNTFHYGKATTCVETFDAFLSCLEAGFQKLAMMETENTSRSAHAS